MKNNSNTENLIKLKESFNRAIDKRINESKINDAVGTLKDMSFNRLVDIFESITGNLMESKEGEKLIGRYLRLIKENKDLRGIYAVSNYIKKPMGINSSQAFINESIKCFKTISSCFVIAVKLIFSFHSNNKSIY